MNQIGWNGFTDSGTDSFCSCRVALLRSAGGTKSLSEYMHLNRGHLRSTPGPTLFVNRKAKKDPGKWLLDQGGKEKKRRRR